MLRLRFGCGGAVALFLSACGGSPGGEVAADGARAAARIASVGHVRDPLGTGGNVFGRAVALSPETLAVMETDGAPPRHVHVYRPTPSGWVHEALLSPPAGGAWAAWTVAVHAGEIAIPGVAPDGTGAVYLYERRDGGWTLARALAVPSVARVALRGNRMLVAGFAIDRGAVWCYERSGGEWALAGELVNPWSRPYDGWGVALALDAHRAVILEEDMWRIGLHAAVFDEVNGALVPAALVEEALPYSPSAVRVAVTGAAVAFSVPGDAVHLWRSDGRGTAEEEELEPGEAPDLAGHELAVGDGNLAVSAPYDADATGEHVGSVRVFVRTADGWSAPIVLRSDEEVSPWEGFGHALAASGDLLAIGAPGAEDAGEEEDSGAVFVYRVRVAGGR